MTVSFVAITSRLGLTARDSTQATISEIEILLRDATTSLRL